MGEMSGERREIRLDLALVAIEGGTQTQRTKGLKDLKELFQRASSVGVLTDKSYHKICEVLFKTALIEKQSFTGAQKNTRTAALNRLSACGDAVRLVVKAGSSSLKGKTVEAIIEHITQTLESPDGGYCEPLVPNYMKALVALFKPQANVERLKADVWLEVVDYCLQAIKQYMSEHDGEHSDSSRTFSGPVGSARSAASNGHSQYRQGSLTRQVVEDVFQILLLLVSAPNAPLPERYKDIANTTVLFLQLQGSNVSQVHQFAFSIVIIVLRFTRTDHIKLCQFTVRELIPVICRIWRRKPGSKDEMLNSVRDEVFILLISTCPHLERDIRDAETDVLPKVEELLDVMRSDHARRSDRDQQLQLDDLEMTDFGSDAPHCVPFQLYPFRIRPHSSRAERSWANLQVIGLLERLVSIGHQRNILARCSDEDRDAGTQIRKRQRTTQTSNRLLDSVREQNESLRLAGLQVIPFVLHSCQLSASELSELLAQLQSCAGDKRGNIGSWALLAIASCTNQSANTEIDSGEWLQLWHVGTRSLTFSSTCRAAALQLHALLAKRLVHYHDIAEKLESIVAAADTSGPVVLCDSTVILMSHLLHVKVTEVPGASLVASQNVVRWLFARWNPVITSSVVSNYAAQVQPHHAVALLRACLGLHQIKLFSTTTLPCGPIAQAWQHHLNTLEITQYLLLLDVSPSEPWRCPSCLTSQETSNTVHILHTSQFNSMRKLIFELLQPKCSTILQDWRNYLMNRSSPVSPDMFRSAIDSCVIMLLLMPQLIGSGLPNLVSFRTEVEIFSKEILAFLTNAESKDRKGTQKLYDTLLQAAQPYVPSCKSNELRRFFSNGPHLHQFFVAIANNLGSRSVDAEDEARDTEADIMDLDDDISLSRSKAQSRKSVMPRHDLALKLCPGSFESTMIGRLVLISKIDSENFLDFIPTPFVDYFTALGAEEVLLSRNLLREVLHSDLVLIDTDAARLIEKLESTIASNKLDRCEVAQGMCLDTLIGMGPLWTTPDGTDVAKSASHIYQWFVGKVLESGIASPEVRKCISELLLLLLRANRDYGIELGLPSARSILFKLMISSDASVKFFIGSHLFRIFNLFTLKDHDRIFVDVLEHLPEDPDWIEGISFRLFVLAKLASNWPTLLRRSIYHVFESAGKIPNCIDYATQCLKNIARSLKVDGPRELFSLFAQQILFTWLESEDIKNIPFQIFGFPSLQDLVTDSQEEATALMVMRGQDHSIKALAVIIRVDERSLIQNSFVKAIAYTIAHETSAPPSTVERKPIAGEARIKRCLGDELFFECLNDQFVDVIATLFNLIDREGTVERHFAKFDELMAAAQIIEKIKSLSSSDTVLPLNQQPTFRAKHLCAVIEHVCSKTQYNSANLYTPVLFTFIARKLLNAVNPALGSLHACSVLRKLRVLIALAGKTAVEGYPLQMLIQSLRSFVVDQECADDAIGILQYLMNAGSIHLLQDPSFVAGTSLSMFGSLKVLLESSKAQESQHRNTMLKAEQLRTWIGTYLASYDPPAFKWQSSKTAFDKLIISASHIESIGNADVDSAESDLLLQLLQDEQKAGSLLSRPSRDFALRMLCSDFRSPDSFRTDFLGADELSIEYAEVVWKSCRGSPSKEYLSWAARVLGRAFAASGHVHEGLLRESTLSNIKELSMGADEGEASRASILSLLREMTCGQDLRKAGLAEVALRVIITTGDKAVVYACQKHLPGSLYHASLWAPYQIPRSESDTIARNISINKLLSPEAIFQEHWLRDVSIAIAQWAPEESLLRALVTILREVSGFADQAFPFIVHLVLSAPAQNQRARKSELANAFVGWFQNSEAVDKNNLKMLLNCILYLRTQILPEEKSMADRSRWLDIDYSKAADAATHCRMFKTALLFVEEFCSQPAKPSRRSSMKQTFDQADMPNETLLKIFENIDDPDLYYGVKQDANLDTILARFEYEKNGPKSLAFRGAQYDSHIRRHDSKSTQDLQHLVGALDVLNLSGLSHSLLQAQQTVGMTPISLESMFRSARKLEQWDIPVPATFDSNAVSVYKAFQVVHTATDGRAIKLAIDEGFEHTMRNVVKEDLSAHALHESLQTLAALVEMDEVFSSRGSEHFEQVLSRFRGRAGWMKTGSFEDISQILSCRGTTLSTLSQQPRLHDIIRVKAIDARVVEVETALMFSIINRAHSSLQDSLSLATSMMSLIKPCHDVGVNPEAAIHIEAANALWDQGEMSSSIHMLQALDNPQALKKQTITVGRSDLLAKIGHQVSVAKLEKADKVIEKYLKPALKELKGNTNGSEAGQVFHQFAVFCDEQLQDPDGLEDLERLQKLSKNKADEVSEYDKLIHKATSSTDRARFRAFQNKAKTWLKLDEEELQRQNASREEFLRQCLENYLLALSASDQHDSNALRFSALWLEHSEEKLANDAVSKHLEQVPSRKFAPLINQLTSRLQNSDATFQQLLFSLVLKICTDHPYHGMYQIYAGAKSKVNQKDESALSRRKATGTVCAQLMKREATSQIWSWISSINGLYCTLAAEKDEQKYRAGKKIAIKDSLAAYKLHSSLPKVRIPPPTMQIDLRPDCNYSKIPSMIKLDPQMSIASGVSAPKIITAVTSDGKRYKQLVKGGNDDLRQDAIMEQVFEQVSGLLKTNRATRQRNLSIRTYKVLPLTNIAGVIEFVPDTIPLHEFLMPAHEKYHPKDLKGSQCRKEIGDVQTESIDVRLKKYRSVTSRFQPVMRYFFTEKFSDPDEWFVRRLAYTRSTAAISILGHVLGLGDRHGHNILLDAKSGEVVHIDLGVAFEMGRVLPVPELVPFRLTRDIVDGMGITKTEGVFRRCCEFTLEALRKEVYTIMTILDVLRYDPLYSWSVTPVRLAKLQEGQSAAPQAAEVGAINDKAEKAVNEPGEADRALTVVNKKLSKTLSVEATINDLINQASDERNLAVLYSGWAAYA